MRSRRSVGKAARKIRTIRSNAGRGSPKAECSRFTPRLAGKLALHEQFFPGWTAVIDGKASAVESWSGAFQAVTVPAGEHTVEFRYRSRLLGLGGGISLVALIGLVLDTG